MIGLEPDRIAAAMGAEVVARGVSDGPVAASIDSREITGGELFFGLVGENDDGGRFAPGALERGAWGVVVGPAALDSLADAGGWVFVAEDPLAAMQSLATAWRREVGATVVGITGSVGKTSVKDITRALLPGGVHASMENYNTEIGLPLTVLSAPAECDFMVLEMAMRGSGQIAELARIAEPDIGAITVVGPVHLELLGSIEAIAAAKAELVEGLRKGSPVVAPVDSGFLEPHLEGVANQVRFGPGGAVYAESVESDGGRTRATIVTPSGSAQFVFPFTEEHNLTNALAAVAIGVSAGVSPDEMASRAGSVSFSKLRGEHIDLADGTLVVNDSYNANPVSMDAALRYLSGIERSPRVAVLGLMAELGPEAPGFHREVGLLARDLDIDLVVGVGPMAAAYEPDELVSDPAAAVELLQGRLGPGSVVLVKGSRSAGLEAVADGLRSLASVPGGGI